MDAIQAILTRRSVRAYEDRQIADTELTRVLEAGRYAPSGMNTQSWHFIAVQNRALLEELNAALIAASGAESGKQCFYAAPTLILVSNERGYRNAMADCACALQNMMLAAHALGLASCWINSPARFGEDPRVAEALKKLGVPAEDAVCGSLAVGYPAGDAPEAKPRREGRVTIVR